MLEAAVQAELAPVGAFQAELSTRIVVAAWRARRADRLEAALLGRCLPEARVTDLRERQVELGYGLIRDGNGPRALQTLVRYRGAVLGELLRALGALKALQAEAHALADAGLPAAPPARRRARCPVAKRNEPEKSPENNDLVF